MAFDGALNSNITIFIEEPVKSHYSNILSIVKKELPGSVIRTCSRLSPELTEFDAFIPKILIMDIVLDNEYRYSLITQLLAMFPDLKIIILTLLDSVPIAVKCMKMGIFDFILKSEGYLERLQQSLIDLRTDIEFSEKLIQLRNSVYDVDTYPMVLFKASENGMDVGYYDFQTFPEQIPMKLSNFLQNIGVSILVAIGQGHNYPEGCYALPAGVSKQYSLLVFSFRLKDQDAMDPRLVEGYFHLCFFIPDQLSSFLPSLSEMKGIVPMIKQELRSASQISSNQLNKLKQKILGEIKSIKSN